jgi:hypothetical protein
MTGDIMDGGTEGKRLGLSGMGGRPIKIASSSDALPALGRAFYVTVQTNTRYKR